MSMNMWWFFGIAGTLMLLYILIAYRSSRLMRLFSVENMSEFKDKKTKQDLVRKRAERLTGESMKKAREKTFAFWQIVKRYTRPMYYWALQQVDMPIHVRTSADLKEEKAAREKECLDRISNDPQHIRAYMDLAELYAEDKKYDDVAEILAHVKKITARYPYLTETYYQEPEQCKKSIIALEKKTNIAR